MNLRRTIGLTTVVGQLLRDGKLTVGHLTPAAERLLGDFLLSHPYPAMWGHAAAEFLHAADLAQDQQFRAELVSSFTLDTYMAPTDPTGRKRAPVSSEQVRQQAVGNIPHPANPHMNAAALNVIAELDAGTGHLLEFLKHYWGDTTPTVGTGVTFGHVLDAYTAAGVVPA
jgi:hypothetical protein